MVDYVRVLALAQRLIEENGRQVTFQKLSATPVNAQTPWKGPATPTVAEEELAYAVFVPHAGNIEFGEKFIDKELLGRCELFCLVAAETDVDLKDFNQIVDVLVTYKVNWMRILQPGTTRLLYVFGVSQ